MIDIKDKFRVKVERFLVKGGEIPCDWLLKVERFLVLGWRDSLYQSQAYPPYLWISQQGLCIKSPLFTTMRLTKKPRSYTKVENYKKASYL